MGFFFDLDETLVHSEIWRSGVNYDKQIVIHQAIENNLEGNNNETMLPILLGVNVRPMIKSFIELLEKENYNIGIFSAGEENYVRAILKELCLEKHFKLVLTREFCIKVKDFYIKDLDVFPRQWEVKLIDNCIFSFCTNLSQGLLVSTYFDSKKEMEIENLMTLFQEKDNLNNIEKDTTC